MKFFDHVKLAPIDPIFGVRIAFEKDNRPNKVNLGIGVYKTSDLKTYMLSSVKQAEAILLKEEVNKEYLPIGGDPTLLYEVKKLVFGKECNVDHIAAIQAVGGTSALKLGGDFLFEYVGSKLFLSDPTWGNHKNVFSHVGLAVHTFPYYDGKKKDFDKEGMFNAIKNMEPKTILFLQGCCHNPTGLDPSHDDWRELAKLVKERGLFPFFDFAYQGFGDGLEEDAFSIRHFAEEGIPFAVAVSFSKNFGLYSERVGILLIVAQEKQERERIESQLRVNIRTMFSNPPSHGAKIATLILKEPHLRAQWEEEVASMRFRISEMRKALYSSLVSSSKSHGERFDLLLKQKGMFSYTGLEQDHVEKLISEYGIYMLKDGRINVSGLNTENISYVVDAIDDVCR